MFLLGGLLPGLLSVPFLHKLIGLGLCYERLLSRVDAISCYDNRGVKVHAGLVAV